MGPRILFHSPYAGWTFHGGTEALLAHALMQRGAEVEFILCDGLFDECDLFRRGAQGDPTQPHRPSTACLFCQSQQAGQFASYGLDWRWMGTWLPQGARADARAFVDALPDEALLDARYRGHPVGLWAQSSAFSQFRLSRIALEDPEVIAVFRETLRGTVLSVDALTVALDQLQPDVLVVFNGRFFSQRVALELARQRGVRVLTHERGAVAESILLREGGAIHELDLFERIWDDWHDVPLDEAQARLVTRRLMDRRAGQALGWRAFSPPPHAGAALREGLQLDQRPIVACFTSSDDEWLTYPERREGPFPDSLSWLPATVQAARESPELQWVIRMHPNLTTDAGNQQALRQCRALAQELPENCRIVQPEDPISSYTLADLCAAGVVYGTTMGVELAATGRAVVAVARGWYGRTAFVTPLDRPERYVEVVREAVAQPDRLSIALQAHRFLFRLHREIAIDFPWIELIKGQKGRITPALTETFAPGRGSGMDALCALILHGEPLQGAPAERGGRSPVEERVLLRARPHLGGAPDREANPLHDALTVAQSHRSDQPAAAARAFQSALSLDGDCAEAWTGLGDCLLRLQRTAEAERALARSLQLDPGDGEAWFTLLQLRIQQGSQSALVQSTRKALARRVRHPGVTEVARRLGLVKAAPDPAR